MADDTSAVTGPMAMPVRVRGPRHTTALGARREAWDGRPGPRVGARDTASRTVWTKERRAAVPVL